MPIRAERVFVEVFKLVSGKTLEQVRRSCVYRSAYRDLSLRPSSMECSEPGSGDFSPLSANLRNRKMIGETAESSLSPREYLTVDLTTEQLDERALILSLAEAMAKSAAQAIPRKLRQETCRWERSDLEERYLFLRRLFSELQDEWLGLRGPDSSAELSTADADEAFQPLIRSIPKQAIAAGVLPNCIGKAQLILAYANLCGAEHVGFIPTVGIPDLSHEGPRKFLRWACQRVEHYMPLPLRLENALKGEAQLWRDERRGSDRMHLVPVIKLQPYTWIMVDPHQGVIGPANRFLEVERIAMLIRQLEPGDVVTVKDTPPLQKLLGDQYELPYRSLREGLKLYRNLMRVVDQLPLFIAELTRSNVPWVILKALDLDLEFQGLLDHHLEPESLWHEADKKRRERRQQERELGCILLTFEILKRAGVSLDHNENPKFGPARSESSEPPEFGTPEQLTHAARLYLEHLTVLIYNQTLTTRISAISSGRLVHSAGEFINGWYSAAIALLSHAGIELQVSDEMEVVLADHSADRFRVMHVAGRPIREKRAPSQDELLAEKLLDKLPVKSHHVRDLLSRIRSHRKRRSIDGTEKEGPENQRREERTGEGETRPQSDLSPKARRRSRGSSEADPQGLIG